MQKNKKNNENEESTKPKEFLDSIYAPTPFYVLTNRNLNANDKLVYQLINFYCNLFKKAHITQTKMAFLLNLSERAVRRSTSKLCELGYVKLVDRYNNVNTYDIIKAKNLFSFYKYDHFITEKYYSSGQFFIDLEQKIDNIDASPTGHYCPVDQDTAASCKALGAPRPAPESSYINTLNILNKNKENSDFTEIAEVKKEGENFTSSEKCNTVFSERKNKRFNTPVQRNRNNRDIEIRETERERILPSEPRPSTEIDFSQEAQQKGPEPEKRPNKLASIKAAEKKAHRLTEMAHIKRKKKNIYKRPHEVFEAKKGQKKASERGAVLTKKNNAQNLFMHFKAALQANMGVDLAIKWSPATAGQMKRIFNAYEFEHLVDVFQDLTKNYAAYKKELFFLKNTDHPNLSHVTTISHLENIVAFFRKRSNNPVNQFENYDDLLNSTHQNDMDGYEDMKKFFEE